MTQAPKGADSQQARGSVLYGIWCATSILVALLVHGYLAIFYRLLNLLFPKLYPLDVAGKRANRHIAGGQRGFKRSFRRQRKLTQVFGSFDNIEEREESCLLMSNHRSWTDGFLIGALAVDRLPALRFLIKWQLLTTPVVGLIFWGARFPLLRRYSSAKIRKNPKLAERDRNAIYESCKNLQDLPTTFTVFPEGTRLTPEKHQLRKPIYPASLTPRVGGIGILLAAAPQIKHLYDVTIIYPDEKDPLKTPSFWQFLCGAVHVHVHIDKLDIPENFKNADFSKRDMRLALKAYVNDRWKHKNSLILETLNKAHS